MKAKKRRNLGVIALIIVTAVILAVCVVWVNIEKSDLYEICVLCKNKLNLKAEPAAEDFRSASFFGNEFRGQLLGQYIVMAEKNNGKWEITKISDYTGGNMFFGW